MDNAGKIKKEWYENSLSNTDHVELETLFSGAVNRACLIDYDDYTVWDDVAKVWLSQDKIDEICTGIDTLF